MLDDSRRIRSEGIQPILSVKSMDVGSAFCLDVLSFMEADWGTNEFTSTSRDGSSIYPCGGAPGNPGILVWIGFDSDIFELHQRLKSKGVVIRQPLEMENRRS